MVHAAVVVVLLLCIYDQDGNSFSRFIALFLSICYAFFHSLSYYVCDIYIIVLYPVHICLEIDINNRIIQKEARDRRPRETEKDRESV